jgi:hypothetical protein
MARKARGTGPKIATTAIIWGFATGMLAICIPLVAITQSGVILLLGAIALQSPLTKKRSVHI